jgi:putative FmdB family regulatory protein
MPTYEYQCDGCGHTFDILQTMSAPKLTKCPECKKNKLHRLIGTGSGVIFKGTGFYETDYKKKSEPKSESKSSCAGACPHAGKCGN